MSYTKEENEALIARLRDSTPRPYAEEWVAAYESWASEPNASMRVIVYAKHMRRHNNCLLSHQLRTSHVEAPSRGRVSGPSQP